MKKILSIIIGMLLTLITVAQADVTNLALTGTATQSSTYPTSPWSDHNAGIAIDGITDGNAYQGHITHTYEQYQAWWQVDLLGMFDLDQIVLWNRTDCCGDRLRNFNVSVLDNSYNTVWTNDFFTGGGYPALSLTIDLPENSLGEIVKVRLNGTNYLSLAEVQVFGGTPVPEPTTMLLLGSGLIGLWGARKTLKK